MRKKWGSIGIWMLGFLCVVAIAYATVVKDGMIWIADNVHIGDMTRTGDLTQTGDIILTGRLDVSGPVTSGTTIITATLTQATTSNDTYYVNNTGCLDSGVTAFAITEELDGFLLTVKHYGNSGTTAIRINPYSSADAIESTQGTLSGTSDTSLDAAGEVRTWQAHYISGASNVWQLMSEIL